MTGDRAHFTLLQRVLHWLMAFCILAMLFIGVGMVSTISQSYLTLVSIHKPLGMAILVLALLRLAVRLRFGAPTLPADLPEPLKLAAHLSHWVFYALLFAMPLVGWSMLSAGGFPIHLFGPVNLPPIMPQGVRLYAFLRAAHTWLALALFATFLAHLGAAMFHGLIRRDGVFSSMARGGD